MKNSLIMLLLLGMVLLSAACKKKDDSTTNAGNQSMSAVINNTTYSYSSSSITESTLSSGGYYPTYLYQFTGNQNGTALNLSLSSSSLGTYAYGLSQYSTKVQFNKGSTVYYSYKGSAPSSGSIIVTASSGGVVTGTFTGVLYTSAGTDSVTVTGGAFSNLVYQ